MVATGYRWTAQIQSEPVTRLASNELDPNAWVNLETRRCKVTDQSGSTVDAGTFQKQAYQYFLVEMRYCPELFPWHRLVITGRPYNGDVFYIQEVKHTVDKTFVRCVQGPLT